MALRCYISYIHRLACDRPDACGQRPLRCPRDSVALRRNPLSSPPKRPTSLPACYPMRPRYASRPVTSIPPRRRSPSWCARRRPACPVRCVPSQRGVSTAVTHVPSPICRGRTTACASSSASASGSAAIVPAAVASSPNGCRRSPPPGRGARAARPASCRRGPRLGRQGWRQPEPALGSGREPEHPAAPAPQAACPLVPHAHRARGG